MSNILATPQDWQYRFDVNLMGQLAQDQSRQLTANELLTNPVIAAILDSAAGTVLSALFVAYKYTRSELTGLSGESKALLVQLTCDLASVMLCQRRGYDYADKYPLLALSLETVQLLRTGERVLDLAANEEAGLTATARVTVVQQARAGLVVANPNIFPMARERGCGGYISPP